MFNVLDLFMEWNREEGMEIRSKYHLKQEAEVIELLNKNYEIGFIG